MGNFKVGDRVIIKDSGKKGKIHSLDEEGEPKEVITDNEIINVIDKVVKLLGFIKPLIRLIFSLFK